MNTTLHTTSPIRKTIKTIFLIVIFFSISHQSSAQQASASTKKKEYLIGDWIPINITVAANKNDKIYFPDFNKKDSTNPSNIEIVDFSTIDTVKDGTNYRYHQLVTFICFDTGKILFEPFPIIAISKEKTDTIYTDAIAIHVAGVAIDTTKDIKIIKPPLKVPYTLSELMPYIIILVGLLVLILMVFLIYKKIKKAKQPKDLRYLLPPHIWALQELEKIKKQKIWQNGEVKQYYSQLSDVLRNYIELRFHLPAMEQTTEEIMHSLHKGIIKQKLKQPIQEFLSLSDFVKFAKAQPDLNDNENAIVTIEEFVKQTQPLENKEDTNTNRKK